MGYWSGLSMVGMAALLSACGSVPSMTGAPFETLPMDTGAVTQAVDVQAIVPQTKPIVVASALTARAAGSKSRDWRVAKVRVNVPDSLKVTESNSYMPNADIVWRGDPYGDRRAQVRDIVSLAVSQAALSMDGAKPVIVDIDVHRFHALSQKSRATIGGWHTIKFDVHIKDQASGIDIVKPYPVAIELKAYGGQKAIDAEIRGETQKMRIEREITRVMRSYLNT